MRTLRSKTTVFGENSVSKNYAKERFATAKCYIFKDIYTVVGVGMYKMYDDYHIIYCDPIVIGRKKSTFP